MNKADQTKANHDNLRPRAAAIIFNPENPAEVLLILRRKKGHAYATLPGGGIDEGETAPEACAREVLEEVNLVVNVGEEVLTFENVGNFEHYFLTEVVSGEMRLGDGPEGLRNSEANFYDPQWVNLARLAEVNLVPEQARELVQKYAKQTP